MRHILVNGILSHNEFGIKAGLCSRSCLPTHRAKTGISNRLTVSGAVTLAFPTYEALVEMMLSEYRQ